MLDKLIQGVQDTMMTECEENKGGWDPVVAYNKCLGHLKNED